MKITFHGHAFIEIECGKNILVDPFITDNPKCDVSIKNLKPDIILLTHAHHDHFGDTYELYSRTKCKIIAMVEFANWLNSKGVKALPLNIGGSMEVDDIHIKMVKAFHSSTTSDGTYAGLPCGFIVKQAHSTIYHAGDTSLFYDMKLIGERYDIDAAFLPVGNIYTMDMEDAARAAKLLNAKQCVPIHYNTFPAIECDIEQFNIDNKVVLEPGEFLEI